MNRNPRVALIGYGKVGQAYHKMFPDAVIYDEPQGILAQPQGIQMGPDPFATLILGPSEAPSNFNQEKARKTANRCDLAIVCVPTPLEDNELDISIVEDVVDWLETPLILIKSALQPGTTDFLVKKYAKKIAVSVELVGEGNYFIPYWKYPHNEDPRYHQFLVIGGEEETAKRCADILWSRMSPSIDIHLVSATEAEICKLMENTWGAMKVTFANVMYDICEKHGANYTKVLQAWGADGRVEKMHMRVVPGKRGWKSKCYSKDIPALAELDDSGFLKKLVEVNEEHLDANSIS